MTDHAPDKHERRFPTLAVVLCVGMLLLVVYVLSFGPASRLMEYGYLTRDVEYFYVPIYFAYYHNETCRAIIDWYVSLWPTLPQYH